MKIKNQIIRFALMLTAVFIAFSCSQDDKKEVTRLNTIMVQLGSNLGKYSILIDALDKTGLSTTLNSAGSYTLLAPSNTAFSAINVTSAGIKALNPNVPADAIAIANLKVVLQNHVLSPGTRVSDLLASGYFKTFGFFRTNAPLPATPVTAIQTTGSQLSIFFNQVGNDVLVNGGTANGGAKITTSDIDLSNGVLHEIDAVLTLPTILNHLVANPNYSTLVSVVNSTSGGTFGDQSAIKNIITGATNLAARTIMVPTNTAFTNATTGSGFFTGSVVTSANITKVLQYHILPVGNRLRTFFTDGFVVNTSIPNPTQTFKTFTTGALGFRIEDNGLAPNNVSKFILNDIQGVNGVLHTVDKVLQPTLP